MKTLLTLLTLFAAASTLADELAGTWTLDIETPRGLQHPTLVINEADGAYSGIYNSIRGPLPIKAITRDGNNFSFPLTITVPMGDIEVTYAGNISGDKMTGKVQNPRGEVPFSGTRSAP